MAGVMRNRTCLVPAVRHDVRHEFLVHAPLRTLRHDDGRRNQGVLRDSGFNGANYHRVTSHLTEMYSTRQRTAAIAYHHKSKHT